jgi:hypothetical protein
MIIRVGIELIRKAPASPGWAWVSTLPKTTSGWPAEALSKIGPKLRQGPHQEAQKSISTIPVSVTICSKFSAVSSTVAMASPLLDSRASVYPYGYFNRGAGLGVPAPGSRRAAEHAGGDGGVVAARAVRVEPSGGGPCRYRWGYTMTASLYP